MDKADYDNIKYALYNSFNTFKAKRLLDLIEKPIDTKAYLKEVKQFCNCDKTHCVMQNNVGKICKFKNVICDPNYFK